VILCLDEFKKVTFPRYITQMGPCEGDTPGDDTADFNNLMTLVQSGVKARVSSAASERVLSEEEINRVRAKFMEEIDYVLEEAIARHVSFPTRLFLCRKILRKLKCQFGFTAPWPGLLPTTL
jgi:hypothetical protein